MNIRYSTINATAANRRLITLLVGVLVVASSHIQPVKAAEVALTHQGVLVQDVRGIMLPWTPAPADDIAIDVVAPAAAPIAPALESIPAPASHPAKKWNMISSPDLGVKPVISSEQAIRNLMVVATAYTSDPNECDSTPFTTANGTRVHDGVIAANFLKFGTRVRIPQYFGDKVFVVVDRMNPKFNNRVDIWMLKKSDAYAWGARSVKIEILP